LTLDPKKVRADVNIFAFEIKPIDRDNFICQAAFNIDPKIGFIP
jgi:hypothetical protein